MAAVGLAFTPRAPSAWVRGPLAVCVRIHESGDGRTSRNLYGMLDGWRVAGGIGRPEDATRAEQDYRAWRLYLWAAARYGSGDAAWCPYDGCCSNAL